MEKKEHFYVAVTYQLEVSNNEGNMQEVEKATAEQPYQFITGLGVTLPKFEETVGALSEGETFDITISEADAYGPYQQEHIIDLDKSVFMVDGHFDTKRIYEGAVLPLVNEEGIRFEGLVLEVSKDKVKMDLNHPLAGRTLHFVGKVITRREATEDEIKGMLNMIGGHGDCCCGEHGDDHECCGGHGHGHGDDHECCGGHGHGHGEDHECCGGHGHGHGEGHECKCKHEH